MQKKEKKIIMRKNLLGLKSGFVIYMPQAR